MSILNSYTNENDFLWSNQIFWPNSRFRPFHCNSAYRLTLPMHSLKLFDFQTILAGGFSRQKERIQPQRAIYYEILDHPSIDTLRSKRKNEFTCRKLYHGFPSTRLHRSSSEEKAVQQLVLAYFFSKLHKFCTKIPTRSGANGDTTSSTPTSTSTL